MSGKFLECATALSLAVLLAACGGDENSTPLAKTAKSERSSTTQDNAKDGTGSNPKPGVYGTSVSVTGKEGTFDGITILSDSGNFATYIENDGATFGKISFDDSGVKGSGTHIPADNSGVDGAIDGEVLSTGSMQLNISAQAVNYESEATLERKPELSDKGISKESLSATYFMSSIESGANQVSITIRDGGTFTGNYGTPCTLTGSVEIPDPAYNVFEATYTAKNCSEDQTPNGSYIGLGYIEKETLEFIANDGTIFTYFTGTK